ncbi:MAG: hypothetical protein MZV64_33460 [Ignavibacteriales bacterium]|nr:hypothetical protein [Ignavibacteriales bacterium]
MLPPEPEAAIVEAAGDVFDNVPASLKRKTAPALPEMSQVHVLRHYHAPLPGEPRRGPEHRHRSGNLHHEVQPEGQRPVGAFAQVELNCIRSSRFRPCRASSK